MSLAPLPVNGGDTVFVLLSAALVLLMTPGLAFFYAGMVRGKNVLNTLMLCFAAIGVVSIQWMLIGYSLAFGPGAAAAPGLVGSLGWMGLAGVGLAPDPAYAPTIPHLAFMIFQGMFAIITPALIAGAIVERVRFTSYLVFMGLWCTLVYDTVAHWVWSTDGWLRALGALDFAGGTVVHITAGVAGLVAALVLGRRHGHGEQDHAAHNVPFVLLGASLLWIGWFGFNAGSALAADGIASLAFVTTHLAAAAATLGWMAAEHWQKGHVTVTGAVSGTIAGLVAITPAAGYVGPMAAVLIGLTTVAVCYGATQLKPYTGLDDSLDCFTIHGVGGIVGALLTGVFASKALNPAGADGALYGGWHLLGMQAIAVSATVLFTAAATWGILKLVDSVMGMRVTEDVEADGLDGHLHGSPAYAFGLPAAERPRQVAGGATSGLGNIMSAPE